MTTPVWAPGTVYAPGAIVQPRTAQPEPVVVINNPGAEAGALTHWTSSGSGTWSVSAVGPLTGGYRFKWAGTGTNAELLNDTHIPVEEGLVVNVTAQINPLSGLLTSGKVAIVFYTVGNAVISEVESPATNDIGTGWFTRTASAIAPATASYARVRLKAAGVGGEVGFDDVTITYPGGTVLAGLVFKATQAASGTSDSTEPTWPSTLGGTVADNDITWEAVNTSRVIWEASPIMESAASEPTWPTTPTQRVTDGSVSWETLSRRVEDVNCPNSSVVAILASKVFAADGDIVRFSATARPLDWTSADDAGFLPTGLQQSNANDMAVLGPYRSNLAAFNASSFQNWQVDPDPAAMAQLDQIDGIGSTEPGALQAIANDLFYLSQLGVRSVSIAAGAENLATGDVGMPVDVMIQAAMDVAAANGTRILSTYLPGAGQYWLAFADYPPAVLAFDTDQTIVEDGVSPGVDLTVGGDLPDGVVGDVVNLQYGFTGGVQPVSFAVVSGSLPPGLTMDSDGRVSGTLTTAGSYPFTVRVSDAVGSTADLVDSCLVSGALYVTGDPPNGVIGDAYSFTFSAFEGTAPYVAWAVSAGALPAGLSLNTSTGAITGTPTTAGTSSFTIQVTDSAAATAIVAVDIRVSDDTIYTFDLNGVSNAGTTSAVGYTIPQTLAPGDTLTLRLVARTYSAWSGYNTDVGSEAVAWNCRFRTTDPAHGEQLWYTTSARPTAAAALAYAQGVGDVVITGVTGQVVVWISDSPNSDNRGGLSYEYTIT